MAEKVRRVGLLMVSTWPRQLLLIAASGWPLMWLVDVFNGAEWVAFVSAAAMGWVLGSALPLPGDVRERLKGAPHGRGE